MQSNFASMKEETLSVNEGAEKGSIRKKFSSIFKGKDRVSEKKGVEGDLSLSYPSLSTESSERLSLDGSFVCNVNDLSSNTRIGGGAKSMMGFGEMASAMRNVSRLCGNLPSAGFLGVAINAAQESKGIENLSAVIQNLGFLGMTLLRDPARARLALRDFSIKTLKETAALLPLPEELSPVLRCFVMRALEELGYLKGMAERLPSVSNEKKDDGVLQTCCGIADGCSSLVFVLSFYQSLHSIFKGAHGLSSRANSVLGTLQALFGERLLPAEEARLRILAEQNRCGDGATSFFLNSGVSLAADRIDTVLEHCSTGNIAAASEAAASIEEEILRKEVQECLARAVIANASVASIPGDVAACVATVREYLGGGLLPHEMRKLEHCANAALPPDQEVLSRILESCKGGEITSAVLAIEEIGNSPLKGEVEECFVRVLGLRNVLKSLPAIVSDVGTAATGLVTRADGLVGRVNDTVAIVENAVRGIASSVGANNYVASLLSAGEDLYTALSSVSQTTLSYSSGSKVINFASSISSIDGPLTRLELLFKKLEIVVVQMAADPSVVKACIEYGIAAGEPMGNCVSESEYVVEMLHDVLKKSFEPTAEGSFLCDSFSLLQRLRELDGKVMASEEEVSLLLKNAIEQVKRFVTRLALINEVHFNSAAKSLRRVQESANNACDLVNRVHSGILNRRSRFTMLTALGIISGMFSLIGISKFKEFEVPGVASMVFLLLGTGFLVLAVSQTRLKKSMALEDSDPVKGIPAYHLSCGILCALLPALAFSAAGVLSVLRLVGNDLLPRDISAVLTHERLCIGIAVFMTVLSACVLGIVGSINSCRPTIAFTQAVESLNSQDCLSSCLDDSRTELEARQERSRL